MILLASSANSITVIFSGVMAAIITSVVTLIGILYQAGKLYVDREDSLFNANQIKWLEDIRNVVGDIVAICFAISNTKKQISLVDTKEDKVKCIVTLGELTEKLSKQSSLLRLLLFQEDEYEKDVLKKLDIICETFMSEDQISKSQELDHLIDSVRALEQYKLLKMNVQF